MDPYIPRDAHGQEYKIQALYTEFLKAKGWHVERLVGNAYQMGIPDIYIGHPEHGQRWIDIKVHGKYNFTRPQKRKWPMWDNFRIGIWILGAVSAAACTKTHMLEEYKLLFAPPNWKKFWKKSWGEIPNIDQLMRELEEAHAAKANN